MWGQHEHQATCWRPPALNVMWYVYISGESFIMAMLYYVALCLTLLTGSSRAKYLDLIFEDNFEKFDYNNWHHEVTAWGGGVCISF